MQVHISRGPGRVFGFTADADGANLPAQFAPWTACKTVVMIKGEARPGANVDECLKDVETFGCHVTDAHVRITDKVTG